MSDPTPIDDDLISAYLDDEASAIERSIIEADADSMARVAELRFVRDAVAAPVTPLNDADRDQLRAAALAASDTSPTVASIAVARAQPTWNWRPLAAVAAAVLVLGLAVSAIRNLDLGGDAGDSAATIIDAAADEPAAELATEPAAESLARGGDDAVDDGDSTEAEMAVEAAAADDSAAEPADEPADADLADAEQAYEAVGVAFDPLLPELGDFESVGLLVDRAFADYEAWLEDPEGAVAASPGIVVPDEAPCPVELDLAELLEVQMSDKATASVGGVEQVIWLFEDGTVYVTPVDACLPVTTSNYFEG